MDRNIDWTDSAKTSAQTNTGESRVFTSQMWLNEMQNTFGGTGVEIIELDSDNSQSSQEPFENIQNNSHMWSYVSDEHFEELQDSYAVNRQARLRRRLRNAAENDLLPDTLSLNQNINCYTILNKDSEARFNSSESFEDVEVEETGFGDAAFRREWKGEHSRGEVVTFNSDVDGEKRMIWIYSFKNRRLLSDSGYELVNISSQSDSCPTSSPDYIDQYNNTDKITCVGRVASPIPPTYIPRLDLSLAATLPNVSEVSEPKSSQTSRLDQERNPIPQKSVNGWFLDKKTEAVAKQDKTTSIVNWMALSPRERRRRSRHTAIEVHNMVQLRPVTEIVSYPEGKSKSPTIEPLKVITEDEANSKATSRINTQRTHETKKDIESPVVGDRGDYNKCAQRPHIKFDKLCISAQTPITEPIEKLDSHNWIAEHATMPYELQELGNDCKQRAPGDVTKLSAADRLSARNMSFLLPSEWKEYSMLGDSHISIQLSLEQDSEAEGRGRLRSLLQLCASCFKCCKYRF